MSLSIAVRYVAENGEKKCVDFELGHQLVGFEVCSGDIPSWNRLGLRY